MAKRKLRMVKATPDFLGVCERCGEQFPSTSPDRGKAKIEISTLFNVHACRLHDSSQNALRVVREATENK